MENNDKIIHTLQIAEELQNDDSITVQQMREKIKNTFINSNEATMLLAGWGLKITDQDGNTFQVDSRSFDRYVVVQVKRDRN